MKRRDILAKVEWMNRQFDKNRDILESTNVQEDRAILAKEFLDRMKETVVEYERLASDYIAYKTLVHNFFGQAENYLLEDISGVSNRT